MGKDQHKTGGTEESDQHAKSLRAKGKNSGKFSSTASTEGAEEPAPVLVEPENFEIWTPHNQSLWRERELRRLNKDKGAKKRLFSKHNVLKTWGMCRHVWLFRVVEPHVAYLKLYQCPDDSLHYYPVRT